MVPKLGHFPCVLWASFQVFLFLRFSLIFDALWGSIWHQFWEKNRSENRSQKRVPPWLKQDPMTMARGSLATPLACALLKQETIARARNVVRIRVHGSGFEKLLGNGCLSWLRLQMFQKQIEKMKRVDVLSRGLRPLWSDTPWAEARRIFQDMSFSVLIQCKSDHWHLLDTP